MICISGTYWITGVKKEDSEILCDINQVSTSMVAVLTHTVIEVEEVYKLTYMHRRPKLTVT